MTMFNVIDKAPGVYYQEITTIGPIPGVSTSTTAIIGPAKIGPINKPTELTNWSDYVSTFGTTNPNDKTGPYFANSGIFAPHAVRGFFDNGGTLLYFVRASNAAPSSLILQDGANTDSIVVTSVAEGTATSGITVQIAAASAVAKTASVVSLTLVAPGALNVSGVGTAYVANVDAGKFFPGDAVTINEGANSESNTISSIQKGTGTFAVVRLTQPLTKTYTAAATMRLADIPAATAETTIRVSDLTGIEPGTILTISDGANTDAALVSGIDPRTKIITLESKLAHSYSLAPGAVVNLVSKEFTLIVKTPAGATQTFVNLSMDPRHSRYFSKAGVIASNLVTLTRVSPPPPTLPPDTLPKVLAPTALAGGKNEDLNALLGNGPAASFQDAIDSLEAVEDVNIICIPDRTDQAVQAYLITHCENNPDRFAILDPGAGMSIAEIETQRGLIGSANGFAAIYYPRIVVADPLGTGAVTIPPSGHLAGVYAQTDAAIGVHKAPANVIIANVLDLEKRISANQQGPMNELSVNVIRWFKGQGAVVYGARTISTQLAWRYVSTRRLVSFVEQSLVQGTQGVVFLPNEPALWNQLVRIVSEFLTRVWNSGALEGISPDQGFSVRCDSELNPPSQIETGLLTLEVKLYPAPPAEFIVFRIYQMPGGPITVQES